MHWVPVLLVATPLASYFTFLAAWHALRRYLLAKETGVPDLENLEKRCRAEGKRIQGTAVVCGGSIAGLLTARICHDFFERVVVIEPEAWLASPDGRAINSWSLKHTRARVMQWFNLHGCQALFYHCFCRLIPNVEEDVAESNNLLTFAGVPVLVPPVRPKTMYVSRAGVETLARRLILGGQYPRIEQMVGTVTGVVADAKDKSQLSAVVVRTEEGTQEIEAKLVADCTGLTRGGLKWLERAGYGHADKCTKGRLPINDLRIAFDQKIHYSSFIYDLDPELSDHLPVPGGLKNCYGGIYTYLEDHPGRTPKFFVLMKPDGNRLLLFGGHTGDKSAPPENVEELMQVSQTLDLKKPLPDFVPEILDIMKDFDDPSKMTKSRLRVPGTSYVRYHLGNNLPSNFVAMGDSVMTINPRYGQGFTKAILGALALHTTLGDETCTDGPLSPSFSDRFFKLSFDRTDPFWQTTRLLDYGSPETVPIPGEDCSSGSLVRAYIWRVQQLSTTDMQAASVIYASSTGFGTSIDAFHPLMALKVLWHYIKSPRVD
ncbi:hypothetical protein FISHEDRAFT_76178 [Fistulina hepatica ATCC 64428]|uniref:FAD/NAD(P)-binding domain-containing protein n=1 Tax=Fistulina hepatica ATCC 64428 TaxID=1128425 RepID=A0A0D7A6E2_9AGAR|nr:hypothetical protein FISHEDRAFT_76178 [Fistulina hepatica ATCC 64428]